MPEFLSNPFLLGLIVGLSVGVFGMISVWNRDRSTVKTVKKENEHLHGTLKTHMDIHSKGSESRERELDQLRKENENLRVTTQTLRQKPGREERIRLQVFEKTRDSMMQQAPGFAPAWVQTFESMQQQIEQSFIGKIPLVNRLVGSTSRLALPHAKESESTADIE